jgi:gamma-glutamyltranspeptidase/glutathione hydrolase
VRGTYRGYDIVSMPPPSSGGVELIEMLNILEGYDLGHQDDGQTAHLMVEAMKRAYADRALFLGDPDKVKAPVEKLISKDYAATWRATIDPEHATPASAIRPGGTIQSEGRNTTHFSVVDSFGNAVSNTYTLNFSYGVGLVAEGTGVILNNELDDFAVKPDAPNAYGLIGYEANAPGPGKRPLSSMTPTIVLKDGKPFLVTGSPGGSRIITAVLHTIINVIDYGMNAQEAVDAPRFHQQWLPETTNMDTFGISPDTRKILEGMGQKFSDPQPANHLAAILVGAPTLGGKPIGNNKFYGANDPRRNTGLAAGY